MNIIKILIFSVLFSVPGFAQNLPFMSQDLGLSCDNLYGIQKRFVEDHISFDKITPKIEARMIDQFIERLDSQKLYLLESDVATIKKTLKGVVAKTKKADCAPIRKAFDIYVKRMADRKEFAKKHLDKKFKIDKSVELSLDPDVRKHPKTKKQADAAHAKYLQFQVSNYVISDTPLKEAKTKVVANYERTYKKYKKFNDEDLYDIYLDSFAAGLDPHSNFFSQDELKDFQISMSLSLEGIGATLSSKDGFTVVEQLVPGGAAAKSGKLKPKDKIIAVGQGGDGDLTNVIDMDLRDVVKQIRGPKGTKVKLSILRKKSEGTERFSVLLVRDKIKLEDEAASVDFIERKIGKKNKKVALINLPSFYSDNKPNGRSASNDLKKVLKEVKKKNADAVVFDVSMNGGGSLDEAVKVAGLFFKTGNVVKQSQEGQEGSEIPLADVDPEVQWTGPMVILTSRISASASEIVAGTLKDYRRAVVVGGDHTFGKGSVQQVSPYQLGFKTIGALKTTVGMFFTAGGMSTQHIGVDSHIEFPSIYTTEEIGEKTLDHSLPPKKIKSFLSKTAYVKKGTNAWKTVSNDLISKLLSRSKKRIAKSKEFKEILDEKAKNKKKNKVIKISELFNKETKKEKEEAEESLNLSKAEKKKKYLERADVQEAINIAVDMVSYYISPDMKVGANSPKK